jgi:hypothetical protein
VNGANDFRGRFERRDPLDPIVGPAVSSS